MKLSINRNNWLFRLAASAGLNSRYQTNICSLFWYAFWGVVLLPLFVAIVSILGAGMLMMLMMFVGIPILELWFWVVHGLEPNFLALFVISAAWSGLGGIVLYEHRRCLSRQTKPNLIVAGYRSWKDKTCVLIDIN